MKEGGFSGEIRDETGDFCITLDKKGPKSVRKWAFS